MFFLLEWLKNCSIGSNGIKQAPIWEITEEDQNTIKDIKWFGRYQVINISPNLTYFLDGAHTSESIQLCSKWYSEENLKSQFM